MLGPEYTERDQKMVARQVVTLRIPETHRGMSCMQLESAEQIGTLETQIDHNKLLFPDKHFHIH